MSSFICSAKHFNSIERKIVDLILYKDSFYVPYSLKEKFPLIYGGKFKTTNGGVKYCVSQVINTLREINVLCVSLQYKHHYAGTLDREIEQQMTIVKESTKQFSELTDLGLYNALRCVSYQIEAEHLKELRQLSEGEENALLFLSEMIDALAHHILSNMPEDSSCRWSIE